MALSTLSTRCSPCFRCLLLELEDDLLSIIFGQLCNPLEPRLAVALSSASRGLQALTQALRQQLKADHEAAAALCLKLGMRGSASLAELGMRSTFLPFRSCKELHEAKLIHWYDKGLSATDLATLGMLGSVLPALMALVLYNKPSGAPGAPGPSGVQRLVEGLGAGALPAVKMLSIGNFHMGDAGASALAAALGQGALPRLEFLALNETAIGNAGLVALAPGLRRLPALETLSFVSNLFGDGGLAALLTPTPPAGALLPPAGALPLLAGALPPPTQGLAKLKVLDLAYTQIADAGCAALVAAFDSGALPALEILNLACTRCASAAAIDTVFDALAPLEKARSARYIRAVSGKMSVFPA